MKKADFEVFNDDDDDDNNSEDYKIEVADDLVACYTRKITSYYNVIIDIFKRLIPEFIKIFRSISYW